MDRPNILLIMTDEQCGHAMSCAGNPHVNTSAMDRLAGRGMRFTNGYTTQPLCVPHRTALQMGCWPHQTGVMVNHQGTVADDAPMYPMIGRLMADGGYRCGYFGKMHIAYRKPDGSRSITPNSNNVEMHGYDPILECGDAAIPDEVKKFLSVKDDRPFFLTTSFLNPHDCIPISQKLHDQQEYIGPVPTALEDLPPLPDNFEIPANEPEVIRMHWERYAVPFQGGSYTPYPTKGWDELRWRQYIWGYYRLIELVDGQIGQVLDELDASGKAENTVIIFTADHGDGAGHHQWNQKQVLYDEVVRVPYVVVAPDGANSGMPDTDSLVSAIDIVPTILDYAGLPRPDHVEGISLRPLLVNGTQVDRDFVVSETLFGTGNDIVGWAGRMVRTSRYKYVVYNHGKIREQLSDLQNDPGEMTNLAVDPAFETVLQEHRDRISEWCRETGDSFLESC